MIQNSKLKRRLVDITYKHKLSHLGSCLTAIDIIKKIYDEKLSEDKFILSNGHAGLALYVMLEDKTGIRGTAEELLEHMGIHPTRIKDSPIDCSTGSLGQGLPIAIGMALADRTRTVYCLISDGECAEGSIWESLRIIDDLQIGNLKVYANLNGFAAYKTVDTHKLSKRLKEFLPSIRIEHTDLVGIPHLDKMGVLAHYKVLDETEYLDITEALRDG